MAAHPYAGPASDMTADVDAIHSFVAWWFKGCNRGRMEIGWIDPAYGGLTHYERFELSDSIDLAKAAARVNSRAGASVYIRASTVSTPDGEDTKDVHFAQSPGCWGDLDTAEQVEQARSVQTMIRPNAFVVTGRVPYLRCQTFFKASEPIVHGDLVRSLNQRVHRLYGGDPAVVNPTRYMRLPGTVAWPYKATRTVPELTEFLQPTDRATSYPLSTLTSQLPQEPEPAATTPSPSPSGALGLSKPSDLIRAIQAGQEWHNNMLRLTAHWIGRGWSDTEILTASEAMTLPGYTATQTRADVSKMVAGGRKRWGVADAEPTIGDAPDKPFPDEVVDFWDTLQAPEFPIHVLPSTLRAFVETRARLMGADPCALAWACLGACSAALDGSIRLQLKRHESWSVPPALWVALIGAPSSKKSPIISAAWQPLERAQAADLRDHASAMKTWESMPKTMREATPKPNAPRRLVTHDATMEKLQELLAERPRGIGMIRDELAGFISGMDRYTSGKGGGERAFFLQAFNGGPYVADRIGRGTSSIDNLLVAICGGIQPDRLAQFGDLTDDGLWQRFIPVIVRQGEMDVDEPMGDEADAYADIIRRLLEVPAGTRATLSEGAHAVRERVAREIFELERAEPLGARFASFVGKLTGIWGRLALILSHIEPSGLGYVVSEQAADAARVLVTHCIIPHAARVYLMTGDGKNSQEDIQSIAGYLLARRADRLLASDLGRKIRASYRTYGLPEINRLLSPLVAGGWLVPETDLPSNKSWLVNPSVHTTFASRATAEEMRRVRQRELFNAESDGDE